MMAVHGAALVKSIVDDLAGGTTSIVVVPQNVDPSAVEQAVEFYVYQQSSYHDFRKLFLPDWTSGSPVMFFSEAFSVDWGSRVAPRTVDNLVRTDGLPEMILASAFTELPEDKKKQWLDFVMEVDSAVTRARVQYPAFCVVAYAGDQGLQVLVPTPSLKVRPWYNLFTLTRVEAELQGILSRQDSAERTWQAALVASLAGSDNEVADCLSPAVIRSRDEIFKQLNRIADEKGFSVHDLERAGIEQVVYGHSYQPLERMRPEDAIYRLWNLGLMDYTAEYGWEVVSWALMPLGLTWIVDHRIWRAQIKLVMPLVDQVRLSVVSYLCGYGGRSWLVDEVNNLVASSTFGSRTIKSCWAAEFSELIAILDNPAYCTTRAVELLQALRLAHSIRNELAHYRPIEPIDYFELLQRVRALGFGP
jgi:hypothetical protein